MLTLSIIVVLYHSEEAIQPLWDCLRAQTFTGWRLIAIDNASGDGAAAFLEATQDPRVTLHQNPRNEGFARAVNTGLRAAAAQGETRCLLLNPDVVFEPNFLQDLMDRWTDCAADVVAPRVMQQDAPDTAWYAGGILDFGWTFSSRHELRLGADHGSRIVEFASGCCLGLTTAALRRIGLLDESFFVYWEDTDFCLRLKSAGLPIHYISEPFLLHQGGASSGGERSPSATRLYYRGYAQVLRKHFGVFTTLRTIMRTLAKETTRPGRPPGHGKRVGIALLYGLFTPLRPLPRL